MDHNIAPLTKYLSLCQTRGQDTIYAKFLSAVEDKTFQIQGDMLTTTIQELTLFVNDPAVSKIEVAFTIHCNRSFVSQDQVSKVTRFPKPEIQRNDNCFPVPTKAIQPPGYKLFHGLPMEPFLSWKSQQP